MLEENVFKIILKETWNEFFKHLSWFLLSLIELSLSWLLFRKNILRLRCSTNQIFRFNLRHKNRLTMIAYKKQIPLDIHWNIWNQKWKIIFDSNLIKSFALAVRRLQTTAATLNFSTLRLKNWWVRKNSNLRPSLYQSDILTNWTTDPTDKFWNQAISSADTRITNQKEIFRQSHLGWPFSWKRFSL